VIYLKLLEYKAKEIFDKYGIPTQDGIVIDSLDGLKPKIEGMSYPVVVKAQVQAGGRGKAGGVRFAETPDEAGDISEALLHSTLKGFKVNKLLISEKVEGIRECYISITLDRMCKAPMVIFSAQGGVDIEETTKASPEKIIKVSVEPLIGIREYLIRYIINKSGLGMEYFDQMSLLVRNLYRVFNDYDCLLAEINPLMITADKKVIALDGKVDIDDSALYRLPDIMEFRNSLQEDELVLKARKFGFLYIPVDNDGNIAVMSNGSGMIMSCIDLISKHGMKVGAALDLGGGATSDRIAEAIRIILSNIGIKALFISIFGGITRCDEVAAGVKLAMESQTEDKIVVVRIEGTNKEKGLDIIKRMQGNVIPVNIIGEGVKELSGRMGWL